MERALTKYLEYVIETDVLLSPQAVDVIRMIFHHANVFEDFSSELKEAWTARMNVNDVCYRILHEHVSEDISDEEKEIKKTLDEYAREMLISLNKLN